MLLANFVTRVFHNNADPETNKWASDTIGRSLQRRASYNEGQSSTRSLGMNEGENTSSGFNSGSNSSRDSRGGYSSAQASARVAGHGESWGRSRGLNSGDSITDGYSETMDYEIEPGDFARVLRTGGPANDNNVTAVWFQAGKALRR